MYTSWIRGTVLPALLGSEIGIGEEPAEAPEMPLDVFVQRMEAGRTASADGLWSWRSGEALMLSTLGVVGEAVSQRATLGDALRTFARGFPVLQSHSELAVEVDDDEVHICYRVLDPRIWPRRADAELTLGLLRGICERYGVPRDALLGLDFEHDADRDPRVLAHYLGRHPSYAGDENRITLATRVLSNTRREGAEAAATLDRRSLELALSDQRRNTPLSHRVRETVLAGLGRRPVSQQTVALQLGLSDRSLRRALAAEGTPFHEIFEDCRRIHGLALLVRGRRPFSEIALLLGYSDQTAFSRAFSRWYGVPPRELRRMGKLEESVIR